MQPVAFVLSAMLALPQFALDRADTAEERRALYLPVAEAIATVATTREDAAFLVAQGWHESRYARAVLTGHCSDMPRGMRCDPDRNGVARARGPWQSWRVACRAEDVLGQARCVLGTAKLGLARCSSWSAAFAALSGRWTCGESPRRVETMRGVLATWGRK